jgi:malate synthase
VWKRAVLAWRQNLTSQKKAIKAYGKSAVLLHL